MGFHGVEFSIDERGFLVSSAGATSMALPWTTWGESPQERASAMDDLGVDMQVISLSPTMHWHSLDADDGRAWAEVVNDDIAGYVGELPERFTGLAFLPLQDPEMAVEELRRAREELGLAGAIIATNVRGADWDDQALWPILEAAQDLRAFLLLHPARGRGQQFLSRYHTRNTIGNPLETTIALAACIFGGVLDRFPGLLLCCAHGGGYACWGSGRFDHASQVRSEAASGLRQLPSDYLRTLYFDSLTHSEPALRYLVDFVGAGRVFLGTDYPADMGQPEPVRWIDSCESLTAEEKASILGGALAGILEKP